LNESLEEHITGEFFIYEEPSFGIKMLYPQSWQREDGNISFSDEIGVVLFIPPSEGNTVVFQPSLGIAVNNSTGSNVNLDNYLQYMISYYQLHLNEFSLLGTNNDKTIAGEPSYMIS
jgi:hypothetical protein